MVIDTVSSNIWAGILIIFAIATDFLDGLFARLLNQVSDLGKIIDPLADKLFVILLGIELIFLRGFPIWIAVIIVLKDVAIIAGSIFVIGKKNVIMQSNIIGKYTFAMQAGLVTCYFLRFDYGIWAYTIMTLGFITLSMISYGKALLHVLQSEEESIEFSYHDRKLIKNSRRWAAVLFNVIFFVQLYYWALENNEISNVEENQQLLTGVEAQTLAETFAPIFEFSANGNAPISAELMFDAGHMFRGSRYLLGVLDSPVQLTANAPVSDLVDADDIYFKEDNHQHQLNAPLPPAYYAVFNVDDPTSEVSLIIQYWMLFEQELTPYPRMGDWQMAAVCLDDSKTPLYLVTTQSWNGVTTPISEVKIEKERIAVFVGERSNAFFSQQGSHTLYLDQDMIFPIGNDAAGGGDTLEPVEEYSLIPITGNETWFMWSGRWGGPLPGGDRGPRYWNPKNAELGPWTAPLEFLRYYLKEN